MSRRSRPPRVRQHVHCDSCFTRRCRAPVEVSLSCVVTSCRLLCGALFHLCKEEEHLLLCPNVRVPCLNAAYGCPAHLTRSSRAAHLQVCPASVVCCSMEWLRWPVDETNPHCSTALQENVLRESEGRGEEALDLAMTLVDQTDLYSRLKMKPLYPELMEKEEVEEIKEVKKEEKAVGGLVNGGITNKSTKGGPPNQDLSTSVRADEVEETVPESAGQAPVVNQEKYDICEMMFSMERRSCALAQANLDKQNAEPKERERSSTEGEKQESGDKKDTATGGAAAAKTCPPPDTSKMGHAPWQEGVLERLKNDLTPQEYTMYMAHHGRMLVSFGQIAACTPREKDFVYGSLEPIPVQTLRSFKIPDSYHYRQRVHLYDTAACVQTETRGVDTSDLGAKEEDWFSDEVAATLLGYAEMAVMGHKISEPKAADGLYFDVGTQTRSFRTAPFSGRTTLADVMEVKPPELHLQLQAENVTSRHGKSSCAFTFLCGHAFHRREFATHFRNVHSDIQTCLSGWFQQRCPLAYLGCTYSQRRFRPSTHEATVSYNKELRSFNLRPTFVSSHGEDSSSSTQRKRGGGGGGGEDLLSSLPYEVLCHMASFLDCLSLSQLALVSQLMRQVCWSQLQDRGMVTLRWEKTKHSHGGARWRAKPVWEFSRLFSSVDSWHFADIPPISAHLKVCPFYQTSPHSEPVALPSMKELQEQSRDTLRLVSHFTANTWQH